MARDFVENTPVSAPRVANRWATTILEHPIAFIALFMLLLLLPVGLIIDRLTGSQVNDASIGHDVEQFYHLGIALLALTATGWWREVGFTRPGQWRAFSTLILPGVLIALITVLQFLGPINTHDMARFIRNILANIGTGFAEEMIFRGIVLYLLLHVLVPVQGRRAVLLAVLGSAVLFGGLHISNLLTEWTIPLKVINQIFYTALLGFYLAAWRMRMNMIWPMIALHAITDTTGALAGPSSVTGFTFDSVQIANDAILLALACYGLWLIRGSIVRRGGTDTSGLSFGDPISNVPASVPS